MRKKMLIIIGVAAAVVGVGIVLNANMLFPWQLNAKRNRKAALEYIAEHFPTAEITDVDYKSMKFNPTAIGMDTFYLELDGICFSLITQSGKVICDTYYEAKAEKYIRENFIDDFMNERELSPNIEITFTAPRGHRGTLGEDVLGDVYRFEGSVTIMIKQDSIDGFSAPKDIGWFYDFYQYWIEKCDIPRCIVYMYYLKADSPTYHPTYWIEFVREKKIFSNEDEFYNSFNPVV